MSKQLLVFGEKTFKITVPDDAKITFGPWSPPKDARFDNREDKRGTLRIYQGSKEHIIAVFSGVLGFRDLTMPYSEQVAKEEGATIWKDDQEGYVRESKLKRTQEWIEPRLPALSNGKPKAKVKVKTG